MNPIHGGDNNFSGFPIELYYTVQSDCHDGIMRHSPCPLLNIELETLPFSSMIYNVLII